MIHDKHATGRAMSIPGGLIIGALTCLLIIFIGTAVLAYSINREFLEWESIGYGIVLVLLLASFVGTATAMGKIKRRLLLVCAASSGVELVILMLITGLFFGGKYEAVGVTACVIISGSVSALMLRASQRGGKPGKKGSIYG